MYIPLSFSFVCLFFEHLCLYLKAFKYNLCFKHKFFMYQLSDDKHFLSLLLCYSVSCAALDSFKTKIINI